MLNKVLKRKLIKILGSLFTLGLIFCIYGVWENNRLILTSYEIKLKNLPSKFEGYKILQLSDVHSKSFGKDNKKLIDMVKKCEPDCIVVTGDLIDRRRWGSREKGFSLIDQLKAMDIAPIYYVSGNHEWWSNKWDYIKEEIKMRGAIVLEDDYIEIKKGEDKINLIGIDDMGKYYENHGQQYKSYIAIAKTDRVIKDLVSKNQENGINILLSHRPELIDIYAINNVDLVFCGHAHGGQFRIPFVGGVIAPGQGYFPEITGGVYKQKNTTMILSRGIGNSLFPFRINNPPEVVLVTLK